MKIILHRIILVKYFDPNGAFINKPPMAEIVALDIISGKIIWKTTWGYENTKDGLKKKVQYITVVSQ